MAAGAHHARRRAADGDPDGELGLNRARVDAGVDKGGPMPALPGDPLVAVEVQEQVELLLEQLVVVGEVEAEKRERLGVGAAPGGDLGPSSGDEVDGGEVLEDLYRIRTAEVTAAAPSMR